jgi:hypothetical protein
MDTTDNAGQAAVPTEKAPDMALALGHRRVSTVFPPGYSWLSVPIRTETLDHLHIQARLSRLSFREFMERSCQDAFPYNVTTPTQGGAPESAPPATQG